MKNILLPLFLIASYSFSIGQSSHKIVDRFNWSEDPIIHNPFELNNPLEILSFDGAIYQNAHPSLPISAHRFKVNYKGNLSVEIISVEYQPLDKKPTQDDIYIQDQLVFLHLFSNYKSYQNKLISNMIKQICFLYCWGDIKKY